ncbi:MULTISPECIES: hypothetical protein [Streptomyces]|uniref:hypothetical protein n=1 Tax=Streptomyces TaxID=1883 RepID=UPI00164F1080|nr:MULTISPECIES: hypothetical protein [unclassified Streptomyces]WSQ82380.1 hypothetical protein OG725_19415 [Streptomyces sp. NBC_01213]WSQ89698.1 hypothetical protein OG722_20025 [Streptomyces sp. NBC_01212]WSR11322.1 hypothetical protein OG265_16215 [Streptomyces sp. NBC_01208]WSR53046.1 hypothetical protein OG279_20150 [Streptomyces sp. NBC_01201]
MRNPVGPLPSSIYWRRRAVAVLVIALLAAVVAWAVTSGGGGGGAKDDGKPGGSDPAPSITPGPSSSGPVVGRPPGGRDESGGSGTGGDAGSGSDGGAAGTGGATGSATGGAGSSASAGATAGTGGGTGGQQVPAGSSLADCAPSALRLSLRTEISYAPDEEPKFRITARNTSAADCKADFGPKSAVLTVTEAGEDDAQVWSSADCPKGGALFLRVPAGATVVHTVEWDRKGSAPRCAKPPVKAAGPGTYLLEAEVPGTTVQPASFVLAKD